MGVYSNSNIGYTSNFRVEEIPGYDEGYNSIQVAMIENAQNQMAIFEGALMCDFEEAYMGFGGVSESQILSFSENVLTDLFEKIKSFVMKVWAKIKAVFRGWMAKIDSVFMSQDKEFVNKYKSEIMKKDLTDMKVKIRPPKSKDYSLGTISEFLDSSGITQVGKDLSPTFHFTQGKDVQTILDNWDSDDELCKILNNSLGKSNTITDPSEYEKEFLDKYFDEEEEDDEVGNHVTSTIMQELLNHKDLKKSWEKSNKSLTKAFSDILKHIEKHQNQFAKEMPMKDGQTYSGGQFDRKEWSIKKDPSDSSRWENDENEGTSVDFDALSNQKGYDGNGVGKLTFAAGKLGSDSKQTDSDEIRNAKNQAYLYQKGLNLVQKYANLYSTAANKYTAAVMKVLALHRSNCRKIWAAAVAYNRKQEDTIMMEAMMELAEYESIA